jgi:hypothetical protein
LFWCWSVGDVWLIERDKHRPKIKWLESKTTNPE